MTGGSFAFASLRFIIGLGEVAGAMPGTVSVWLDCGHQKVMETPGGVPRPMLGDVTRCAQCGA